MQKYYILSLKWLKDNQVMVWWQPESNGYCLQIDKAGIYTQTQIDKHPEYYNNGKSTLAVPCESVRKFMVNVLMNDGLILKQLKKIANQRMHIDAA